MGRRALKKWPRSTWRLQLNRPYQRVMIIVACLAILVAVAGIALVSFGSPVSTAAPQVRVTSPLVTPSPTVPPSPTIAPHATATATATKTVSTPAMVPSPTKSTPAPTAEAKQPAPAAVVPPASEPVTITFDRIGLRDAPVAQMAAPPNGGVIEPPTDSQHPDINFRPYWISSFGKPGANATDTVYIVGHACTGDCWQASWSVFNHLGEAQKGDRISFRTQTGTVTYEVTKKIVNQKDVPEQKAGTWAVEPGGMRIIACYPGDFDGQNVTVFGKIVQ